MTNKNKQDPVYNDFFQSFVRDVTTFGGTTFYAALTLFTLLIKEYQLTINLTIGFFLIMLISILARMIHFKNRPKKVPFTSFVGKMHASSFPSVHTTKAFFLAVTFANFFNTIGTWILLITAASFIAWSRIKLKKHDLADVNAGTILGLIIATLLIYLL